MDFPAGQSNATCYVVATRYSLSADQGVVVELFLHMHRIDELYGALVYSKWIYWRALHSVVISLMLIE